MDPASEAMDVVSEAMDAVSEAMDAALAALEARALQEERQHQLLLYRWSLQASVGQTLEAYLEFTGQRAPGPLGSTALALAARSPQSFSA